MDAFDLLQTIQSSTVPDMDGRYRTKFTACYHATIHVGDGYTDDLLVMLQVVPLLLYCWIEQDHFIAHEVNNFFIDKLFDN